MSHSSRRAFELFHGFTCGTVDALSRQHNQHRMDDDLAVQREGDVPHIIHVVVEFVLPCQRVPTIGLRITGQAWADIVSMMLLFII